jgi:hypothetical protein
MNQGNTNSIPVNIPSEFATLRRVVMFLANPMSVFSFLRQGGFDIAAIYQLWHNKWAIIHDYQRVRQQQRAFIEVMERNGVEVLFAEAVPGCFTQHYTRDIGFAIDDTFFCANPRRRARQRELEGLRNLLPRFSKVARLENGTIEGGDVIVDEQYIIVGLGGKVPDQRAGAIVGDGGLQLVEVDWPGEPAGGCRPYSEAGFTAPGAERDTRPDLSGLSIGETCPAPAALVREVLSLV